MRREAIKPMRVSRRHSTVAALGEHGSFLLRGSYWGEKQRRRVCRPGQMAGN